MVPSPSSEKLKASETIFEKSSPLKSEKRNPHKLPLIVDAIFHITMNGPAHNCVLSIVRNQIREPYIESMRVPVAAYIELYTFEPSMRKRPMKDSAESQLSAQRSVRLLGVVRTSPSSKLSTNRSPLATK